MTAEVCPDCGRVKATSITEHGSTVPFTACAWHLVAGRHDVSGSIWLANCYGETIRNLRAELEAANRRIVDLDERLSIVDNDLEQYR